MRRRRLRPRWPTRAGRSGSGEEAAPPRARSPLRPQLPVGFRDPPSSNPFYGRCIPEVQAIKGRSATAHAADVGVGGLLLLAGVDRVARAEVEAEPVGAVERDRSPDAAALWLQVAELG